MGKSVKKKAVSDVIVIVLMIIIVIMAVLILWRVILPLLGEKTDEIPPASVFNENIKIDGGKTNFLTEPAKVTITRTAGELSYYSIKIIFYNASSSYTHTITGSENLPKPLETKTYYVYLLCKSESYVKNYICEKPEARLINATHFAVYITYISGGGRERIVPIPETYDRAGVNCKKLGDLISDAMRISGVGINDCGEKNNRVNTDYNRLADVNNDKYINATDRAIFMQNNGNEAWCLEQLTKQEDPCKDAWCKKLLEEMNPVYGKNCSDEDYLLYADLTLDGLIDIGDLSVLTAQFWPNAVRTNEKCKEQRDSHILLYSEVCFDKGCPTEYCVNESANP